MIKINNILEVEKYIDGTDVVIFDLDDTLYSEKEYVRSGFKAIAEQFCDHSLELRLWTAFEFGKKPLDTVFDNNEELSARKEEALKIYRTHDPDIRLYPGVSEMIERIRHDHKVGIITDGRPEGQRNKIKALCLEVDEIIITDELGGILHRKPDPLAFEIMSEKTGCCFSKMVYIGDNLKKDILTPERLGMRSVFFDNCDGLYYQKQ